MAGASRTITVRLPEELYERVEKARGKVPREPWIRDALEQHLSKRRFVHVPKERSTQVLT